LGDFTTRGSRIRETLLLGDHELGRLYLSGRKNCGYKSCVLGPSSSTRNFRPSDHPIYQITNYSFIRFTAECTTKQKAARQDQLPRPTNSPGLIPFPTPNLRSRQVTYPVTTFQNAAVSQLALPMPRHRKRRRRMRDITLTMKTKKLDQ
jgi:hypothetical protein